MSVMWLLTAGLSHCMNFLCSELPQGDSCVWRLQEVYEQLLEREKRVKGQEVSVSTALGERERALQNRQDQLALELQDRERRLRSHEDECLATDRQLAADKAALDRARQAATLCAKTRAAL